MVRRITGAIVAGALAALLSGCGNPIATAPGGATTTETFTGTLMPSSANNQAFITLVGGPITATLTTVSPDSSLSIGFDLGTFNSTTNVCTSVFDNPAAVQGFVLNGNAATTGSYCIHVYDNGSVQAAITAGTVTADIPFSYVVTVVHP